MSPVAVPEKIIGLTHFLDFFDRCHSLTSLHLPQAALRSLPPNGLVTFSPAAKITPTPKGITKNRKGKFRGCDPERTRDIFACGEN